METNQSDVQAPGKSRRGFAAMDPARVREIARRGGQAAHEAGTAHEWTPEEARKAGSKGGTISRGGRGRAMPEPWRPDRSDVPAGIEK